MSETALHEKKFSKEQAIKFGWQRMKDNLGFFIVYLIILFLVEFFFSFFIDLFSDRIPSLSLLFNLGSLVVTIVSSIFAVKIGLRLYDNEKIGSLDFLAFNASMFFKFLVGYVLFVIIVFIGPGIWKILYEYTELKHQTMLMLIGGFVLTIASIYLAIKYQFFQFLIVEKDMDVFEAFKESGKMTDGYKWNLFLFALLLLLIVGIGALVLLVGLFVAIPIVMVAWAYVYKKLSSDSSSEAAHAPPPIPTQSDVAQSDNSFQAPAS